MVPLQDYLKGALPASDQQPGLQAITRCTQGASPPPAHPHPHPRCSAGEKLDLDKERKVRTPVEMAAEAAELRRLFH